MSQSNGEGRGGVYRDELEQAKKRIAEVGEQLAAQREELAALRAQLDKRRPPASPPRRGGLVWVAGGAAVVASALAWFVSARRDAPPTSAPIASGAQPSESAELPEPPPRRAPRTPRSVDSSGTRTPGAGLDSVDPARIERLHARCERPIAQGNFDGLPKGAQVVDFKTCEGCDCCEPGGVFPAHVPEREAYEAAVACERCGHTFTLAKLGLTTTGGRDGDPIDSQRELVFRLARPSKVFAVQVSHGGYGLSAEPRPDAVVAIIARDVGGRPIDGARFAYRHFYVRGEEPEELVSNRAVLLVQGCDGEQIGRVDLFQSDYNVVIEAVGL